MFGYPIKVLLAEVHDQNVHMDRPWYIPNFTKIGKLLEANDRIFYSYHSERILEDPMFRTDIANTIDNAVKLKVTKRSATIKFKTEEDKTLFLLTFC